MILENTKLQIIVSVLLAFTLSLGFLHHSFSQTPDDRKVAVIVLDGADFEVLDKLKQEGELPNIKEMEQEGLSTDFKTPTSFSPQEWTMMGSGMSEENISIDRDWSYEDDQGNQRRLDSNAVENRRFWSYLNEYGVETGVYHWVMTWPVEPVDGFMVSGFLSANLDEMTYPDQIKIYDEEVVDSLILFNTFDTANNLIEEYRGMDVMVFGFQVSDRLQHSFWTYVDDDNPENDKYRELMYTPYKEVDEMVGDLRPEYTVILVSDHGFTDPWVETYRADINDLLQAADLAKFEEEEENLARDLEFSDEYPLEHLYDENEPLNATHYNVRFNHLNDEDPNEVKQKLSELGFSDGSSLLKDIEYSEGGFNAVMYLNPDEMHEPELDEVNMQLSYARGELPILEQKMSVSYRGERLETRLGPKQTGDHPAGTDGVFYIAGEGVREEGRTDINISSKDLTPIILYLKGVPIPEEVDGDVPKDIFATDYQMMNSPEYADIEVMRSEFELDIERDDVEEDRINERLEDLGYLR